jgi:cell division protease FtsH
VLLVGQPGTGKTLLARAVAGQARVPFLSANASEFVEMIVGVGSSRVRDLFRRAKEAAPAIIFIDEIDAIGRRRGGPMPLGGHNEQEQTLNQILAEMDGFEPSTGVIVIAATNRADVLDQALLRPGRFDRQVMVHPPDKQGRRRILQIHTRKVPLAPDVDLSRVAAGTPGLVGADLRNLVNEASLLAARHSHHQVMREDFDEALTKVVLGAERHLAMTEADRERIAYHEAGHALVGLLLPGADPVRKVSIVPRGRSLGSTFQSPVDERFNYPEEYVRGRITGALGGRAAERIVYEGVSTGAEDDLRVVTELARNMVTRWGMSPKLGPLDYRDPEDGRLVAQSSHGPDTARVIDAETKRIVEECFEVACELLSSHRDRLEGLARALIAEETLDEPEIRRIAGDPDGRFPRAS